MLHFINKTTRKKRARGSLSLPPSSRIRRALERLREEMGFSSSAIHKTSSIDAHFARSVITSNWKNRLRVYRNRFDGVSVIQCSSSTIPRGDTAGAVMSVKSIRLSRGADDLLNMTSLDQTIRVEPSDCCGLIGPNGCGKSSLLKAIGGLIEHDSGDCVIAQNVRFDFDDIQRSDVKDGDFESIEENVRERWRRVRIRERRGGSEGSSGMGKSGRR